MAMASDDSDTQMKWAFPLFLKTQKGGGLRQQEHCPLLLFFSIFI